jgi:hypothetical protein
MQFREGELAGAIDCDEEVELAFGGVHFGDVDVEVTDGIGLERLLAGLSPWTSGSRLMP